MKITAKVNMETLKKALNDNFKLVQKVNTEEAKNLVSRITYTSNSMKKDAKSVKRADLVELVKDTMKVLGDSFVEPTAQPVAEANLKPTSKGKKPTPVADKKAPAKKDEPTEDSADKKAEKKAPAKQSKEQTEKKAPAKVTVKLPDTLKVGDDEFSVNHDIKTMDDLHGAYADEDTEIVIAFWWTKKLLKQYKYADGVFGNIKDFPDDLDITTPIHVSDDKVVAYALSNYTEALYQIMPTDLEEVDGIRYANGVEYQIYTK